MAPTAPSLAFDLSLPGSQENRCAHPADEMPEPLKSCTVVREQCGHHTLVRILDAHLNTLGCGLVLERQYRRRAPEFGQDCAAPLSVLNARTDAFLSEHIFDTQLLPVHPVEIDGEFVVLRTPDAPPPPQCIASVHADLIALAEQHRVAQAQAHALRMASARQRG